MAEGKLFAIELLGESYGSGLDMGYAADGRLTLESGVPVSTSDQSAKTTLYYTPYTGNRLALYNGSAWLPFQFSELSLSLSGFTADRNYDIWAYDNSGTPALEALIWTDATTRATALVRQDGVLVKSGDATRRYLGTIRINATGGQCDLIMAAAEAAGGGRANIGLWNMYNRVTGFARVLDSTASYTYTTATWRQLNAGNGSGNRVSVVRGLNEDAMEAHFQIRVNPVSGWVSFGFGVDSTSATPVNHSIGPSTAYGTEGSYYRGLPGTGFHYLAAMELGASVGSSAVAPKDASNGVYALMATFRY